MGDVNEALLFLHLFEFYTASILFFYPCPLAAMIVAKMRFLQVMEYKNYIHWYGGNIAALANLNNME